MENSYGYVALVVLISFVVLSLMNYFTLKGRKYTG
jgi:hypothetical protein